MKKYIIDFEKKEMLRLTKQELKLHQDLNVTFMKKDS